LVTVIYTQGYRLFSWRIAIFNKIIQVVYNLKLSLNLVIDHYLSQRYLAVLTERNEYKLNTSFFMSFHIQKLIQPLILQIQSNTLSVISYKLSYKSSVIN